jgi:hypothetical protein
MFKKPKLIETSSLKQLKNLLMPVKPMLMVLQMEDVKNHNQTVTD